MSAEKRSFSAMPVVLMIGALLVLGLALWSGFTYVSTQNGGNVVNTILGELGTLFLVVSFIIGMAFTLRKKLWGLWVFGTSSILMFIAGGMPGFGGAMSQLGAAGFLGVASALLVYRERHLLS